MLTAARKALNCSFGKNHALTKSFHSDGRAARQRPDRQPTESRKNGHQTLKRSVRTKKIKQRTQNMRKQTNDEEKCLDCRCGNAGNDCDDAAARGITGCQSK